MPAHTAYCSGIWLVCVCIYTHTHAHTSLIYNLNNFYPSSKHSLTAQLINKLHVVSGTAVIRN